HAAIDTHEGAIDIARLVGREINGHLCNILGLPQSRWILELQKGLLHLFVSPAFHSWRTNHAWQNAVTQNTALAKVDCNSLHIPVERCLGSAIAELGDFTCN